MDDSEVLMDKQCHGTATLGILYRKEELGFIEKEQAGAAFASFRLLPPYSRGRVWAEPTKKALLREIIPFPADIKPGNVQFIDGLADYLAEAEE